MHLKFARFTAPLMLGVQVALLGACLPEVGPCDEQAARTVVYSDDAEGIPLYAGQALIQQTCGNGAFCHAEGIETVDRHGAPAGLDFDLDVATDAESTERLRRAQRHVYDYRRFILKTVRDGRMPPGAVGAEVVASARAYRGLESLDTATGREALRNWLACGAPVVERTRYDRPPGTDPVGAVVAASPFDSSCAPEQSYCSGLCIGVESDSANCGGCDMQCATGQICVAASCDGCVAGLTSCATGCVDTNADVMNCGACGNACPQGQVCANGGCASGCPVGTANCSGSCVTLSSSVFNCGACGTVCDAGDACAGGTCTCPNTVTDPLNCGACGNVCPSGSSCVDSQCTCAGALELCDGSCADTSIDEANCGGCGNTCASGESCADGSCQACGTGVSFAVDVQPIFSTSCASSLCHTGNRPAGNLALASGSAYAQLVGVPADGCMSSRIRVVPGDPAASYLMDKLLGINMCKGKQMPASGAPLSSSELSIIADWICGGARND